MKLLKISAVVSTLCAVGLLSGIWVYNHRITNTCLSEYYLDFDYPNLHLTGYMTNLSSNSYAHLSYNNVEGAITLNNKPYHFSREQTWYNKVINKENGLSSVTFVNEVISSIDSVQGTEVNVLMTGKPHETRIARMWRLNDDVLLVGNAYSPLYSCVRIR
jgi:hypothetical protein